MPSMPPTHTLRQQDADVVGADFLGQAIIPVSDVVGGQPYDAWLDLTDLTGATMQGKDLSGCVRKGRE